MPRKPQYRKMLQYVKKSSVVSYRKKWFILVVATSTIFLGMNMRLTAALFDRPIKSMISVTHKTISFTSTVNALLTDDSKSALYKPTVTLVLTDTGNTALLNSTAKTILTDVRKTSMKFKRRGVIRKYSYHRVVDLSGYKENKIPTTISRFDLPWLIPARVNLLSLKDSKNRVLYSPVKEGAWNGLGHNMATVNAEIWTALRLNLTYSHRITKYSVHSLPLKNSNSVYVDSNLSKPFIHAGSIEQFFGWGVGEIPRERIQRLICPRSISNEKDSQCQPCNDTYFQKNIRHLRHTILGEGQSETHDVFENAVFDRIVELPLNLTYLYPYNPSERIIKKLNSFMKVHSEPNTVFTMPLKYCNKNFLYNSFGYKQKSFFFHKYWDSHKFGAKQVDSDKFSSESFKDYKKRVTSENYLAPVGRRPALVRLRQNMINIAVHARRGDFFKDKQRVMISARTIFKVICTIVQKIIRNRNDPLSKLPISIIIYSEGFSLGSGVDIVRSHDTRQMRKEFVDVDGKFLLASDIHEMLLKEASKEKEKIFGNGLRVITSISDNTVLSLHEMISADIFIGSDSSMSYNIVGTLSRAAFQLLRTRGKEDVNTRFVNFNQTTGDIKKIEIRKMTQLWDLFVKNNKDSVKRMQDSLY